MVQEIEDASRAARAALKKMTFSRYQIDKWENLAPDDDKSDVALWAKFDSNAFHLSLSGDLGFFDDASRFNHSCDPNADWDTSRAEDSIDLWAMRDIKKGCVSSRGLGPGGLLASALAKPVVRRLLVVK
ncbi:hypothetical protein K402DRAFT_400078 [Aulographum hederae CBS 113979]|uniref:SET domain-containing protein n=1 Tax=Aulographum hederae CBS 113979 TaxID=1176131 RepID=A0A6G1HEF6_9PEZI|nr:hypothetical protein K402DRAFT_400078 [Aulographum hederae CBS 113979]